MTASLSATTSHIAGVIITIDERAIQRCAVCGLKLADIVIEGYDHKKYNRMLNGSVDKMHHSLFEPGSIVVQKGHLLTQIDDDRLNDDACISLVERGDDEDEKE